MPDPFNIRFVAAPAFQGNFPEFHFIDGLFHGFVFCIPLSAPILICISRFFLQGPLFGFFAFLGTVLGQLCFFFVFCANSRFSVSIWYTLEPFLALFGATLAFGFATHLWSMSPKGSGGFAPQNIWGSAGDFYVLTPQFRTNKRSEDMNSGLGWAASPPETSQEMRGSSFRSQNPWDQLKNKSFSFFDTQFTVGEATQIFALNFLFMFLNPAMPATSSRILFASPQLFDYSFGWYALGFILMATVSVCLIWPFILSMSLQIIQKGLFVFSSSDEISETRGEQLASLGEVRSSFFSSVASKISKIWKSESIRSIPSSKASRFLSFLIAGCVLSGTLQYSWRLFTQYPLETIVSVRPSWTNQTRESGSPRGGEVRGREGIREANISTEGRGVSSEARGSGGFAALNQTESEGINQGIREPNNSTNFANETSSGRGAGGSEGDSSNARGSGGEAALSRNDWNLSSLREFPSFDSNIRHRERNLSTDKNSPSDKLNARRILSGKIPLTEEQKSDAYFKFHAFFVNAVEKTLENKFILARLPEKQQRDFNQIEYLQQLKTEFQGTFSKQSVSGRIRAASPPEPLLARSTGMVDRRPIENNTKGKTPQGFSYIRDFISAENPNSYIHDELQVYRVLFGTHSVADKQN